MKGKAVLMAALVCICGMSGCQNAAQNTVGAADIYSFPEPAQNITVTYRSQGVEQTFEIGAEEYDVNDLSTVSVINWFYGLELRECEEPEPVEGDESYSIAPGGLPEVTYVDRGSTAYISVDGLWYEVTNPSDPPIGSDKTEAEIEDTTGQVKFGDRLINEADLSEETLEWLDWYNGLTEFEQLSISSIPSDLLEKAGISGGEDTSAVQ